MIPDNRKSWTLAVSFGLFMIMLDNTVVPVPAASATPPPGQGFGSR